MNCCNCVRIGEEWEEQKCYIVFHQTMDGQRGEASPKQSAKKVKNGTNPAGLVPLKKVGFLGAVPLELKL